MLRRNPTTADPFFKRMTFSVGMLPLAVLCLLVLVMIVMSWPSIHRFGLPFLWGRDWLPALNTFGALPIILGTLITSFVALLLAAPLSFGAAVLMTQILSVRVAAVLARLIELMAAVPSIIYGIWGFFVLGPFLSVHVFPWILQFFAPVPVLNTVFGGIPVPTTILTASFVLAIMIIPLITSMMRDVLKAVPPMLREAAYGVGLNRWQVVFYVLRHYARAGLLGSMVLGLGRALGETMAVTFVIGNAHGMPKSLMMPGTTISAAIANEFTNASSPLYLSSLIELALILLAISFITLWVSRSILKRGSATRGGSQ